MVKGIEKEEKRYLMIEKNYGTDFNSPGGALTLNDGRVDETDPLVYKEQGNGWKIRGRIHEDYYTWVNEFEAEHPTLGKVWGDFETTVYADSEEGFQDFYKNNPPTAWNYSEI